MEIIKISDEQYKGSCNGCKSMITHEEMYNLDFGCFTARLCKTCLYDLEEMIISARIKKNDANYTKGVKK